MCVCVCVCVYIYIYIYIFFFHIEGRAKGSELPSEIFGLERVEVRRAGGNCMTRYFMICTLHQMLVLSYQEDWTGGACGSHKKEQKRVNSFDAVT